MPGETADRDRSTTSIFSLARASTVIRTRQARVVEELQARPAWTNGIRLVDASVSAVDVLANARVRQTPATFAWRRTVTHSCHGAPNDPAMSHDPLPAPLSTPPDRSGAPPSTVAVHSRLNPEGAAHAGAAATPAPTAPGSAPVATMDAASAMARIRLDRITVSDVWPPAPAACSDTVTPAASPPAAPALDTLRHPAHAGHAAPAGWGTAPTGQTQEASLRRIASFVLASFVAVVAVAPGTSLAQTDEPVRGGRVELVAGGDLANLDNAQAVSTIDYNMVAGALYEGLYSFDSSGTLQPRLADGMPVISEDGLVHTFTIKPGAMFAGPDFTPREVTASDVAFGLTRALDPDLAPAPSWGGGYLMPIKGAAEFAAGEADAVEGIRIIDDRTLEVTLAAPSVTFLYGLTIATSWPVPPEAFEERGEDFASRPVGAGPFQVQTWNKGSDITLVRNPGYVDPALPYLDEMHISLNTDENTQVLRIESGDADAVFEAFSISPASLRLLGSNPDVTVTPSVGPRIYYLALENAGMFAKRTCAWPSHTPRAGTSWLSSVTSPSPGTS